MQSYLSLATKLHRQNSTTDSEILIDNRNQAQLQSDNNVVSRSESLYYTPDDTLEKLSDLSINENVKQWCSYITIC